MVYRYRKLTADARRLVTAKQFEPINLHSILEDVKTADFDWVQLSGIRPNQAESRIQRTLVERCLHWLFEEYLIPLLKVTYRIAALHDCNADQRTLSTLPKPQRPNIRQSTTRTKRGRRHRNLTLPSCGWKRSSPSVPWV